MSVLVESCTRKQATIEASYNNLCALFGQPSKIYQDKITTLFEAEFLDLSLHLDYFVNNASNEALQQNPDTIYTWTISSADVLAPDRLQNFINFVNNAWTNDQKYSPASTLKVNIKSYYDMNKLCAGIFSIYWGLLLV